MSAHGVTFGSGIDDMIELRIVAGMGAGGLWDRIATTGVPG
ncbi:hypothetical protein [Nonomuraea sp. NPDC050202]